MDGHFAIKRMSLVGLHGNTATFLAETAFVRIYVEENMRSSITETLRKILGRPVSVEITVPDQSTRPANESDRAFRQRASGPTAIAETLAEMLDPNRMTPVPDAPNNKTVGDEHPLGGDLSALDARWSPRSITELSASGTSAAMHWVLRDYLARGTVTSLSGLPKSGKTLWLCYLLRAMGRDNENFCGRAVERTKALVITEEAAVWWEERRHRIGIGAHVELLIRPFGGRPDFKTWQQFIGHIAGLVRSRRYGLVVFDTLPYHWPVRDENAADDVLTALETLHTLTSAHASVLVIAHTRKSDGGEGRATRGSGALKGFADVVVELRRHDPERAGDRRRVLTGYSRSHETPRELVVDFDVVGGYSAVGSKSKARTQDRSAVLRQILPETRPGATVDELRARWPTHGPVRPGVRTLRRDLEEMRLVGQACRTGTGRRPDPFRYALS